jgi:Zn-dependent protease
LIAAAGPAANVLLAVAASICLRIFSNTSPAIASITLLMIELNLLLAVFNMVPVPPLDGGNVLAGLLPGALADKFDSIRPYGFLIIYALLFTGVLSYLVSSPYSPYTLLLSWLHV